MAKTFNVLPWLQDTTAAEVWTRWQIAYRDVLVVDAFNRPLLRDNLTSHDLGQPQYYNALKAALLAAAVPADTDADGLPDDWELGWFGNLSPTPTSDEDGDGADSLSEFTFGSSPASAASVPTFLPVVARPGGSQVLAMVFRRFVGSAAELVVETSSDLVTWSSGPTEVFRSGTVRNLYDGVGGAEVRYQQPSGAANRPAVFMRARAILKTPAGSQP
ncbi:MAG: hypothetical protein IT580_17095 [Verrucomicrobiales bacterium]|nr:hypothetical protein [Verrucomicrobiales bacterium]